MKKKTCSTCIYRDLKTKCCRCPKIKEIEHHNKMSQTEIDIKNHDCLVYSYYESGSFWVGDDFGCIHHKTCSIPCYKCVNNLCTLRRDDKPNVN